MKYKIATLNKINITDFALERNNILKRTKSDWIFFVDSDERISKELKKELNNLEPKVDAYFVKRKNFFLGQFVGTDKIIRLMKKGSGKWDRRIHELYHLSGNTRIGEFKNYLIHNTAGDLFGYIAKMNAYSTLHSLANKKEGKRSNLFKIVFFPIFKFLQTLIKSKNIVFSIMASLHSFLSWSKQYLKQTAR